MSEASKPTSAAATIHGELFLVEDGFAPGRDLLFKEQERPDDEQQQA